MKAMVLAAGLGRRLKPLTDQTPKALTPISGMPILEIVIRRLIRAGAGGVIVNTHHLAGQIEAFLNNKDFGVPIAISREEELLDTGGGLKKASWFFDDEKPFFVHNVDVLSEIDLPRMYRFHQETGALATLAASARPSSRYFLFNEKGILCGWEGTDSDASSTQAQRLAFNGIHVISPEIFTRMSETGVFSITQAYLRMAKEGARIQAFRTDGYYYKDIGTAAKLEEARRRAP